MYYRMLASSKNFWRVPGVRPDETVGEFSVKTPLSPHSVSLAFRHGCQRLCPCCPRRSGCLWHCPGHRISPPTWWPCSEPRGHIGESDPCPLGHWCEPEPQRGLKMRHFWLLPGECWTHDAGNNANVGRAFNRDSAVPLLLTGYVL